MKISFRTSKITYANLIVLRGVIGDLIEDKRFRKSDEFGIDDATPHSAKQPVLPDIPWDTAAHDDSQTTSELLHVPLASVSRTYVDTVSPPPPSSQPESVPEGSSPYVDAYDSQPGDLDSDGEPWDATIHSESHAKNVNGTWRKRRNTKDVEVKTAVPGLEAITPNSVPAPPRAVTTPVVDAVSTLDTSPLVRVFVNVDGARDIIVAPKNATDEELSAITGKPTVREVTQVPVPPPPPVVKTASQDAPAGTFSELMRRVTKHFGAQRITSKDLVDVCATFNIASIQECYTSPGIIPLVSAAIDAKAGV